MRAGILRQNFGKFGQIVLQLFGKHIGRIDDEHAAAVHTKAVTARRMDMKLGVQIIVGSDFFEFVRQFAAFFAAQAGIPNHIAAGFKAFQGIFQNLDDTAVVLFFFVGRINQDCGTAGRGRQ